MPQHKKTSHASVEMEDLIQVRIVRLLELISQFAKSSTKAHGLRNTDLRILNILDGSDGVSVNEIARQAHIDKAWVSRSLRVLEANDMVTRRPAENDSRLKLIALTKKSKGLIEGVRPLVVAREKKLLKGIDGKKFKRELDVLMRNAEALLEDIQSE